MTAVPVRIFFLLLFCSKFGFLLYFYSSDCSFVQNGSFYCTFILGPRKTVLKSAAIWSNDNSRLRIRAATDGGLHRTTSLPIGRLRWKAMYQCPTLGGREPAWREL